MKMFRFLIFVSFLFTSCFPLDMIFSDDEEEEKKIETLSLKKYFDGKITITNANGENSTDGSEEITVSKSEKCILKIDGTLDDSFKEDFKDAKIQVELRQKNPDYYSGYSTYFFNLIDKDHNFDFNACGKNFTNEITEADIPDIKRNCSIIFYDSTAAGIYYITVTVNANTNRSNAVVEPYEFSRKIEVTCGVAEGE